MTIMKRALAVLASVLALSSFAFGQTKDKTTGRDARVEQELRDLVRMWDAAYVSGDATALDRLLADEFAFVGGENKATYLASVKSRSPEMHVESAVSENVTVQVYGNAAVVTGLDTIKVVNKGQVLVSKWLFMDVWVKRSKRWQCVKTYSSAATKT